MPLNPQTARIALVDDDSLILRLLVRILAKLGYPLVTSFTSSEQALGHIRTSAVDLLFLDINMPHLDGVEFIRQLASSRFRGGIVVMSGEGKRLVDSVDQLVQSAQLRSVGSLRKPFNSHDVKQLLSRYDPELRQTVPDARRRPQYGVEALRSALARGELVNHYQPILELATGEVLRVETLVRWQHPTDGCVYPDQFLPAAETSGLLPALTRVVMANAMTHVRTWHRAGCRVRASINITMHDIGNLQFPDEAEELALEQGISPADITLEITEGQAMQALSATLDVLSRLRLKRFRLSMDDFGTGHSSLAQLRRLPFDEIKLDRGFVHGAAHDERRRAICVAGLEMARTLQLDTVAEGIEEQEDLEFFRMRRCGFAQGYLIAKPMAEADLASWLSASRYDPDAPGGQLSSCPQQKP
jgi:EAL domain-containing protein (putative c-di-GMP-specific phosphodiesterase class I)/FixJ family two-component response regulator